MKLNYSQYYDKIMGAWIGKSAGGIIGFKQENNKNLLDYNFENVFPEHLPPNDDFDLQVLYLFEILEKKGINFSSYDLGRVFAKYNKCWANEYRIAIDNINRGINPPYSGTFNNEYFQNSNGCPIRSEIWALISPCNPELAKEFAQMDGQIDHGKESIQAEKLLTAMEAKAFEENDIDKLLDFGLAQIDKESDLFKSICYVREARAKKLGWQTVRGELVKKFGSCDASYSVINTSFVVLSLLYGERDFEKSMLLGVNCGYDTDCTAATVGAILGLIYGYEKIPAAWKEKIGNVFFAGTVDVDMNRNTYEEIAKITADVGIRFALDGVNRAVEFELDDDYVNNIPACLNLSPVAIEYPEGLDKYAILKIGEKEYRTESTREIVVSDKDRIRKFTIGVIKPATYKLYGPFFDCYDTKKYDKDPYNREQPREADGSLNLFAMFNGYVDIDNEYLKDDSTDNVKEDKIFHTLNNLIKIEEQIGYKGPCCCYIEREFVAYEDEECFLLIGNNDAYKIWLNGELIAWSKESVYWYLQNNTVVVKLKKGVNKLKVKLIRRNAPMQISLMFSKKEFGNGVHVNID